MRKTFAVLALVLILVSTFASLASAVFISSVSVDSLVPGGEAKVKIYVENDLNSDIEDVSLALNLAGLPFSSYGSTEDSVSVIESDDKEYFSFTLKADNDAETGNYNVPYTLTYDDDVVKTGTIGVTISGSADLTYSVEKENPVVGSQGKLTLKIVNKGIADARFVSIKVIPSGFTLLSDGDVYIGEIKSDDFETEKFDVIFTSANPILSAVVEYVDFNNEKIEKTINLPVDVYSRERALELGIIKESRTGLYFGIVIGLLLIWFVWRKISKARKRKKTEER